MRQGSFGSACALLAVAGIALGGAANTAEAGVVPPEATDLGSFTGDLVVSGSIAPNEVLWYRFFIDWEISPGQDTYFDITTNGSDVDTEIGLYDAAGVLVDNNDDDGIGLDSTLTFGTGSGMMLGDVFNLGGDGIANGENGSIGAGVYYLAFGEFNVDFGPDGFDVVSTGTDFGGDFTVSFFTNIPAPGATALLGMGGLLAARRRR